MAAPTVASLRVKVDGRIVPAAEACVNVLDHGFLYGDSVYETMRSIGGKVFRLPDHLERLRRSSAGLRLPVPWPDTHLEDELAEVMAAVGGQDHYLRLIVTRGRGELGYSLNPDQQPNLMVIGGPFEEVPEARLREGFKAVVVSTRRNHRGSLPPSLKTGNLLNPRLAALEAQAAQADEALMLNLDGNLCEASTSNLFLVLPGGVLATPDLASGLLEGVTRRVILELAAQEGITVREEALPASLLDECEEAFLSSTTRSVAPLKSIDKRTFSVPGPVTDRVMRAFKAYAGAL